MKQPSSMNNNYKIFELLRGLQKEAEAFNNDFGDLSPNVIDDFCNTIYYYVDEIRSVLNGDNELSQLKEVLKQNKVLEEIAKQSGVVLPECPEDLKGLPELKRCIMCDKILPFQTYSYPTNHYLCSSECTQYYLELSTWSNKAKTFILNEELLNNFRKIHGINPLNETEIEKRIDNKDRKEILKIFGVDEDEQKRS